MATLFEYYNTGDDGELGIFGVFSIAQIFTPSVAHTITSVKLKLRRHGLPGTLTVSIKATDGTGKPTGGALCSGTIDGNSVTTDVAGAWYEITLGAGFDLVAAGTQYAIEARAPTGDAGNWLQWRGDSSSPTYTEGYAASTSDGWTTWSQHTDYDLMFEDWGDWEPTPPTPAAEGAEYQKRALVVGGFDVTVTNPLPVTSEMALDCSTATGGTVNTLIDTTRGWQVNIWEDAMVEVEIGGIHYMREIDSNTADTLDFTTNPLPAAVVAGSPYCIKRVVSPLNPITKANEHNTAELAGVDILAAALAPTNTPCLFRTQVAFDAAGVFSATVTSGGVMVTTEFNHGVVLPANSLFMFDMLVHAGDTINFRYSVNCTMLVMRVQEVVAAVQ